MAFGRTSSLFRNGRGFHPNLGLDHNTTQTARDDGASPFGCSGRNGFQTRLLGGSQTRLLGGFQTRVGMGFRPVHNSFVNNHFDPNIFLGGR